MNALQPGTNRVGWYSDGLPSDVTPDTGTLLSDDGVSISLTIPWLQRVPTSQVERWFFGSGVHYGDDPDRKLYSYALPRTLSFVDVDGPVQLLGCRAAGGTSSWGSGVGQGTVHVSAAVLGADVRRDYTRVNGLRTEIPGLGGWMGLTSLSEARQFDAAGRHQSVTYKLKAPESIKLSAQLNLSAEPDWSARGDKHGNTVLTDRVVVQSMVIRPRPWPEHLKTHLSLRNLVAVAQWVPVGFSEVEVLRHDAPRRMLSGDAAGPRWCSMRSYAFRHQDGLLSPSSPQWFSFADIGSAGFRRWLRLETRFSRGVLPMLSLLDMDDVHIESRVIQSALALEAIGYQLALDEGIGGKKARHEHLDARLKRILEELPLAVVEDDWPQRSADVYNGVKHANRQLPDVLEMVRVQRENILVFRAWVSHRVGVRTPGLGLSIQRDDDMQWLLRRGLAPAIGSQ